MFGFGKSEKEKAQLILEGIGNKENIKSIESCFTRLRIQLEDINKVNRDKVLESGAKDVIFVEEDMVHVVLGTKVDEVKKELLGLLN